jgi:hypothetical protein
MRKAQDTSRTVTGIGLVISIPCTEQGSGEPLLTTLRARWAAVAGDLPVRLSGDD